MNILVTGANGQLGTSLRNAVADSSDNYIFTDIEQLDITSQCDIEQVVATHNIDVIVNCAAYTRVDDAEKDAYAADVVNHLAVKSLATVARDAQVTLIHISTDYVFGGNLHNTPCTEEEPVNPTGVYGTTKLAGEKAIIESGCAYIIIRTSWLYSPYGKNFLNTMLHLTATRPQVSVVCDQIGTPTYAAHLAATIRHIIDTRSTALQGIYHYSNQGACSWYDFAHAIAHLAGHTQCRVLPCHSDEYPSAVVRPPYSVLDKTKIIQTFAIDIPHWYDALKECMAAMNSK